MRTSWKEVLITSVIKSIIASIVESIAELSVAKGCHRNQLQTLSAISTILVAEWRLVIHESGTSF